MSFTKFSSLAAVTVLAISTLSAPAQAADQCKTGAQIKAQLGTTTVKATGSSAGGIAKFRLRRAERRATNEWEDIVADHFGKKFADIDDAKNVDISCGGLTERGNPICTVIATPCKG